MPDSKIKPKLLDLSYKDFIKNNKTLEGMVIEKYIVYQKLGEGAFGSVFRGMNDSTKEQVAVKLLDLEAVQKQKSDYVKKIKRRLCKTEAEMMLKCDSPNLIKCFDIFQNKSLKVMIIEFCNEGQLQHQINKKGNIPQQQAILILKQILNGLAELHKHKIIHRDLKPENILVHNGVYKIADFGFSKQLDEVDQIRQTKLGTIYSMAPEVIQSKQYGLNADIWSIGVIFYNMVFGKLPYQKLSYDQIIRQIKNKNIFDPKFIGVCIKLSQTTKKFITDCLTIDSKARINWQQIVVHPIFKNGQEQFASQKNLLSHFRRRIALNVNDMLKLDSTYKKMEKIEQKDQKQQMDVTVSYRPTFLTDKQLKNKKKQVLNLKSTQMYSWSNLTYLQCLKTELILKYLIEPIEKNVADMLQKRQWIQLLYLLSTRCFNNMSFIRNQMKNNKDQLLQSLRTNVASLYEIVNKKFQRYSSLLTKKESQIFQIMKDKFEILFKKQEIDTKDKFMAGIQFNERINNKEMSQYTKAEQIDFTAKNLKQLLPELKTKNVDDKTISFFVNYQRICNISLKQLKNQNLQEYIQDNFFQKNQK